MNPLKPCSMKRHLSFPVEMFQAGFAVTVLEDGGFHVANLHV